MVASVCSMVAWVGRSVWGEMGSSWAFLPMSLWSDGLAATMFFGSGVVTLGFGSGLGEEEVLRRSRRDLAWASMLEVYAMKKLYKIRRGERRRCQGVGRL